MAARMPGLENERVKRQSKVGEKIAWTLWWLMEEFNGGAEDRQIIGVKRWSELACFSSFGAPYFFLLLTPTFGPYNAQLGRDMSQKWPMQSRSQLK
jgi:hypothetical protein